MWSCGERREQGVGGGSLGLHSMLQFPAISSRVIKTLREDKRKVTLNISCCSVHVWYLFLPFPILVLHQLFFLQYFCGVRIQQMRSKLFASLVAFQLCWF